MNDRQTGESLTESYARWRASDLGRITDSLEQQLLLELLGPVSGQSLLDVGCGDAAFSSQLARRGAMVTALDANPAMIAAARRRAGGESTELRLVEGRAEALPFRDATFDRVVAVTVLCFVGDAERAVGEMARVLKPGGCLVIGEIGRWNLWAAYRRIRGWIGNATWRSATFRTARDLRRLAETAGLDVVQLRGAILFPPAGIAAKLMAPIDLQLGRQTTFAAAFIAMSATKAVGQK
jgi:SAM-dependent methyltransferase